MTCHGFDGAGGAGPPLNRPKLVNAPDDAALRAIISDGIPDRGMPRVRRTTDDELRAARRLRALARPHGAARVTGNAQKGTRALRQARLRLLPHRQGTGRKSRARSSPTSASSVVRSICGRRIVEPGGGAAERHAAVPGRGYSEFLPVRVVLKDGAEVRGIRLNEDLFTIQVRDHERQVPFDSQERRRSRFARNRRQPDAELCRPHQRRRARRSRGLSLESWEVHSEDAEARGHRSIVARRVCVAARARRAGAVSATAERRQGAAELADLRRVATSRTATRRSTQINRQNVAQLKLAWVYQMQRPGIVETSPIVVDGVMYITEPPKHGDRARRAQRPAAVDLHAEHSARRHRHRIAAGQSRRRDPRRHGVRRHGPRPSHRARREVGQRCDGTSTVEDNKLGYYLTLAPLALDGKIIVGVSGAETGIRGFVDAYDAKTGKLVWRTLHRFPAPGEPGSETWGKGDGWKTGGGSTWLTGSYDPELNLLYWATGNPGARLERATTGPATTSTPTRCSRSIRRTGR